MDNGLRAQNVLNAFASKDAEDRIISKNQENLDLFAEFVLKLSNENATAVYMDSNGTEWTMFWFSRRIGHQSTWEMAWDNMGDEEKGFNVVNMDMVCALSMDSHSESVIVIQSGRCL